MEAKDQQELRDSLKAAIDNWIEYQSEDVWVDSYVGDGIADLMADAALAVLLCSEDTSRYLKREGLLRD